MAKIPFMKLADMETIKSNAKNYLPYFENKDNLWLDKILKHSPFGETKYELPDFALYMPEEGKFSPATDKKNVREVYEKLKWLSDSQASEERLWAGLCFGPFWNYVQYRWKIQTPESIKQHYFFAYNARRSLTRNAVSRLWWIGRLTYDSSREDPFELTDFVCEYSRFIVDVLERNVSNSRSLMKEFLGACVDSKKMGLTMDTNTIRELEKYLDLLGGIYVLDYMPEGFVYNKIVMKAQELMKAKEEGVKKSICANSIDKTQVSEVQEEQGKIVSENSRVLAIDENGKKYIFVLKKKHYHTKPKSIVGKKVGDIFYLGPTKLVIKEIED